MVRIVVDEDFAFDFRTLSVSTFANGTSFVTQSEVFRVNYPSGHADEFRGEGFEYDSDGYPVEGTLKTYNYRDADTKFISVSKLDLDIGALAAVARTPGTTDDLAFFKNALRRSDTIVGGDKRDFLFGFKGNDTIDGDDGKDTIYGGRGADVMFAGKDNKTDTFVFLEGDSGRSKASRDEIFEFDRKNGDERNTDKIDLTHLDVKWSDIDISATGSGKHVKVAVDYKGDSAADMVIVVMHTTDLNKSDFLL